MKNCTEEGCARSAPEPVLRIANIQGLAIPGFFKPSQMLIYVRFGSEILDEVKNVLRALLPDVTTARKALSDRRHYRHVLGRDKPVRTKGEPKQLGNRTPLLGIGFTSAGLRKFIGDDEVSKMKSPAFDLGLPARSSLLGDPASPAFDGHPDNWLVGASSAPLDLMIVVAGDEFPQVCDASVKWIDRFRTIGANVGFDRGEVLRDPADNPATAKGREHFGFVDNISQPGIRGRSSHAPRNFLTERVSPERPLEGLPGQDLVWPGEFVLGYPKSGPDPAWPGPIAKPQCPWMKHGSFLVYRRLRQDVAHFHDTMNAEARRLRALPGFQGLTPDSLASLLMGRTQDGTPLTRVRAAKAGQGRLADDPLANNDFRFDSDTPMFEGAKLEFRSSPARADPLGLMCPLASHIRKVNPRDAVADSGGTVGVQSHRILRVGITYSPHLPSGARDTESGDRGVLFMCIQASIEEQFEFLQARWMNDDRRPKAPSGHDMIAGRGQLHLDSRDKVRGHVDRDEDGGRRCTIFGSGGQEADVNFSRPAVTPTGGGYFFLPSLLALHDILGVPIEAAHAAAMRRRSPNIGR